MKGFLSIVLLSALFITSYGQTTITPAPTSCVCNSWITSNYTTPKGCDNVGTPCTGCIAYCYGCSSNICVCWNPDICGEIRDVTLVANTSLPPASTIDIANNSYYIGSYAMIIVIFVCNTAY